MTEPTPAGEVANQEKTTGWKQIIGSGMRMIFMYYIIRTFKASKEHNVKDPSNLPIDGASPDKINWVSPANPLITKGSYIDMYVFINDNRYYDIFDMSELAWSETAIPIGEKDVRKHTYVYEPPKHVVNSNSTVWMHTVIAKAGDPIEPGTPGYDENSVFLYTYSLSTYLPKRKNSTGVNLLDSKAVELQKQLAKEPAPLVSAPRELFHYLRPNLTIQFVDHFQSYATVKKVPPQLLQHMTVSDDGYYRPLVYFNDFWLLKEYLVPVNETLERVEINLEIGTVSLLWWQLLSSMEQSFKMQSKMGLSQEADSDDVKRIFLEGNPLFLALTMAVSLLHTVFDMLAFKNDIGFWRDNKSMEGLSARTVLINAGCQIVILLYLLDNETSFVILFSSVMGAGIEIWKVTKAFSVKTQKTWPFIKIEDRASYANRDTKQLDEEAGRYLSYALYPLVIGYALWSLKYKTHKSWYSWLMSSLVGAVYMFGFILMCPQLYLNYKLKSVAHLPWRQMMYKFLNTIIDDLFAFVIKMPLLHRLSVFRDDLVFVVYLYQRWVYRVDKSRTNEFGWSEAQVAEAERKKQEPAALEGEVAGEKPEEEKEKEKEGEAAVEKPEEEKEKEATVEKRKGKKEKKDEKDEGEAAAPEAKKDK